MVSIFQIILSVVIIALSSVLTLVGIQVFLILKEAQKTFQKINLALDEAKKLVADTSQSLTGAATGVSGFLGGIKTVLRLLTLFKEGKKK